MREDSMLHRIGMTRSRGVLIAALLVGLLANASSAQIFEPPLTVPAIHNERLANSTLLAVASAGERLVAVGLRGGIIVSDDQGKSWTQAQVPVSTDLVAVTFVTAKKGWAVGHGGVVLHSEDAGLTWIKQLDGLQAGKLAIDFYTQNSEHIENAESFLSKEQNLAVDNETQPFLDVFFSDEQRGYVVGTFNRIFMTEDGGKSWVPMMHLTNNPQEWHFYSVSGAAGQLYLTGEQGRVWRLDGPGQEFSSIDTPYNGTLFGVAVGPRHQVYAYGMRGSFFRSADQGQSWQRVALPSSSNITRLISLDADRLLLVAQGGEVLLSSDGGQSFKALPLLTPMPYYGAALLSKSQLALVGALGVRVEAI